MALNQQQLKSSLGAAFTAPTDDFGLVGSRIANAYADYALNAQSCQGGFPNPFGAIFSARLALRAALTAIFATSAGMVPATVGQVASAIALFWTSPPIDFIGTTAGLVVGVSGPSLQFALLGIVAADAAVAASGVDIGSSSIAGHWASILHAWTQTVVVAHAPPSVCTGPIF